MKKFILISFVSLIFISCSMEKTSENPEGYDGESIFVEFMPCQAGPDYSVENMQEMIGEWRSLLTADELRGAWGYAPASESNAFGNTGWWELNWSSQDAANAAWSQWGSNAEALAWTEKYESVLSCDEEGRNSLDAIFPVESNHFGTLPESGYFYSEFYHCFYNEGSSKDDAVAFLPKYTAEVYANSDGFEGTSFHFGNYFAQLNEDGSHTEEGIDFLWASFTNSEASMVQTTEVFESSMRSILFPQFSEFATCRDDVVDVYHGWTFYNSEQKDFMPDFSSY